MTRSVAEWIGATPETAPPPRVKLRIIDAQGRACAECGRKLGVAGERIEFDHTTALVNGGENRERNLRALCAPCHGAKTRADVAKKSTVARKRKKALGFDKPKRGLPGSKSSGWKQKIGGGWVRRDEA
ncbi:MAG: HNH endonuclease [Rhodosalinus sp.]